jgi:mono/diheme cytochrome c family protein
MKIYWQFLVAAVMSAAFLSAAAAEDLSGYSGHELYRRFCASCHGAHAEGNGPVASFFKLQPPDLTRLAQRHGGQFPAEKVRQIIDGRSNVAPHGSREMPVWGLEFVMAGGSSPDAEKQSQAVISRLVEYLASIQSR